MTQSLELKYPFVKAHKAACYIIDLLRPHCTRIHMAGSLRRMRPEVKDIEIVCQPKTEIKHEGLFQEEVHIIDRNFTEALATITDIVIKGNVEGRYMQIRTNSKMCPGIYLDLFMPQQSDYFRQYAIRTGSAEYVQHVIAAAWKRKGWAGVKDLGLRKISECDCNTIETYRGQKIYTLKTEITSPTIPPAWISEWDFYNWLGLEYIDPEQRELHKPINESQ